MLRGDAEGLQGVEDEVELVEQVFAQDDVLGPDGRLVVREEVAQREVRGETRVRALARYLDEAVGILILLRDRASLAGPEPR